MALAQRGMFEVYNRLPIDWEFQWDSYSYVIPKHSYEQVPSPGMAKKLIIETAFKYGPKGISISGIVLKTDPNYGKPLEVKDIWTGDPIKDNQITFSKPEELEVIPVQLEAEDHVQRRHRVDQDVTVGVGAR